MAIISSSYHVKHIMESMGWLNDKSSEIPIANAENRQLMETINVLLKRKTEKTTILQETTARVKNLEDHTNNSEHDIEQNLKLLNAHRSQLNTEDHLYKLAAHDESRLNQQIKELQVQENDFKKNLEKTECEITKLNQNISRKLQKLKWIRKTLDEWQHAIFDGEKINKLIEKYSKEDENRLESLEIKRKLVQNEIFKRKKILIASYEEQKSLEKTLERTAQLYRQTHFERRHLVATWKEAVSQMNQRESEIVLSERELEDAKILTKDKNRLLEGHTNFFNQLIANNKETEDAIEASHEKVSLLRKQLNQINDDVVLNENEVSTTRKMLQGISQQLQQRRQRNRQAAQHIIDKEQTLERTGIEIIDIQERHERFKNQTFNAQERLKELNDLMESEEKSKDQLEQELSKLDGLLFRSKQHFIKMKDEEKVISTENRGLEITIVNMRNVLKTQEKEMIRKTDIDYDLALKQEHLELRISNLQGTNCEMEPKQDERLIQLEELNKEKMKQLTSLQAEISKIEDSIRRLTISYNNDAIEVEKMRKKINEKLLICEGAEKELRTTIDDYQEKIVEMSLIKMRIHDMEKQIEKQEDKTYTIEKHRIEFATVVAERLVDIKSKRDLLFLQRKNLHDELSGLKADLGERKIKIVAMKKRYEIAMDLMGRNDDGTLITTTQIKIQNAQEKEILFQEGNELNEKVLKAEDDIKAMENTLCLMNFSNDAYRKNFEKFDDQNPELVKLQQYEDNYCKNLSKLKKIRNSLTIKAQELDEIIEKRDKIDRELEEMNRNRLDVNEILMKIHKELMEQKTKLERAERELRLAKKSMHQRCSNSDYILIFEKELDLRELAEKNNISLQLLNDFVDSNPEVGQIVSKMLFERGMKMPSAAHRVRSQCSWKSDYSDRSSQEASKTGGSESETSPRVFSASSKGSVSGMGTKINSRKVCTAGSLRANIVSIDFPGDESVRSISTEKGLSIRTVSSKR